MEPLIAYLHYLAMILIAGFLVAEMVVCRPSLEAEQVRIRRRRRTMVGGDDDVAGRIVEVRQRVERNPSGPFRVASCAISRQRAVA